MGIHIHIRCMGCIHQCCLNLHHVLHSSVTSRFHSRNRNNLHDMDNHIRCCYSPSNRILRNSHCYHHSSHHSTSTNHHHVGCLMSIRSLRSIRCNHGRNQVLRMDIRIHNRCMGCIHQCCLNLHHVLHSSVTSRFHSHNRNNLHDMDSYIRCCYSPSNHILHSSRCYHHNSHRSTSTNHHHVGCLMSIRSLRSIRCN